MLMKKVEKRDWKILRQNHHSLMDILLLFAIIFSIATFSVPQLSIIGSQTENGSKTVNDLQAPVLQSSGFWDGSLNISKIYNVSVGGDTISGFYTIELTMCADLNGDGYGDYAISRPYADSDSGMQSGKVYIFLGHPNWNSKDLSLSDANLTIYGEAASSNLGYLVASGGDINGDGFDDLLISAPQRNVASSYECGEVYLVWGRPGLDLWGYHLEYNISDIVNVLFLYDVAYINLGCRSVEIVGDLNDDGYDDFIIGTKIGNANSHLFLVYGRDTSLWSINNDIDVAASGQFQSESAPGGGFPSDAIGIGDVNSDGYDDFICSDTFFTGSWSTQGKVYLIYGESSEIGIVTSQPISDVSGASFLGEGVGVNLGDKLASVGDVNNDGYDDYMIHCKYYPNTDDFHGKGYLIFGQSSNWGENRPIKKVCNVSFEGLAYGINYPFTTCGIGDFNLDNYDDFLIADPRNRIDIVFGRPSNQWASHYLEHEISSYIYCGTTSNDYFGAWMAGNNDINGDGIPDFILNDSKTNNDLGRIYTIFGRQESPTITSPNDINYDLGEPSDSINWHLTDTNTLNPLYTIIVNNVPDISKIDVAWTSGDYVIIDVNDLDIGIYNYTIVATDGFGGRSQDTVLVTVSNTVPIISKPANITITEGDSETLLSWHIIDENTLNPSAEIFKDSESYSTIILGSDESEYDIYMGLAELDSGIYSFEIEFSDGLGETISDIVSVIVEAQPDPDTTAADTSKMLAQAVMIGSITIPAAIIVVDILGFLQKKKQIVPEDLPNRKNK